MSHTKDDLRELQSKPLEEKIQISTARIIEWYESWGGQVYISNSGGVDSTVLSWLVHRIYPDVIDVYCDTGLEYPELRKFIMNKPGVVVLKPKMNFIQILSKYGYPIISKEVSRDVSVAKHKPEGKTSQKFNPDSDYVKKYGNGWCLERYSYLIEAPFDLSNRCCNFMKKDPMHDYNKANNLHPYIGTMTEESQLRKKAWLESGCNAYKAKNPQSSPMSFWSKSDVLHCLLKYNIPYVKEIYGDIVCKNGVYTTTKQKRTGCIFCGFGCHLEKEPNKFQTLSILEPKLYDYCMRGGKYDDSVKWVPDKGLGMAKVLDFINVKWWNDGDEAKRDEYRAKYKEKEQEHETNQI